MAVCPTTVPDSIRALRPSEAFLQAADIAQRLPLSSEARQWFLGLYRILENDLLSSPSAVTDEPVSLARSDPALFDSPSYFAGRADMIRCNLAMLQARVGASKQWSPSEKRTYGWVLLGAGGAWATYHVVRQTPAENLGKVQSVLATAAVLGGILLLRS